MDIGIGRASEADLRKMAASGMTHREIAEHLGRPLLYVSATLSVLGISTYKPSDKPAPSPKRHRRAAPSYRPWALMYETGSSLREIAEVSGVSWTAVRERLLRDGVQLRPRGRPSR